jgi:hypothetical protein
MILEQTEECAVCRKILYKGESAALGSAGTGDGGAIYCHDCYSDIVERESAAYDAAKANCSKGEA